MAPVTIKERRSHGLRALNSRHPDIRKLKRNFNPTCHGHRIWPTSWLLIDYLSGQDFGPSLRVMDLACGWGLAGIYCAKSFGAELTSVDVDWDVYPYLFHHARINGVEAEFLNEPFESLPTEYFGQVDLLIGSDLCFWEKYVPLLEQTLLRALTAGVGRVVLADPGRPTFDALGEICEKNFGGRQFYWRAIHPFRVHGQIIEINSDPRR